MHIGFYLSYLFLFALLFSKGLFAQVDWSEKGDRADSLRRSGSYKASIPLYKEVLKVIPDSNAEKKRTYQIRIGLSYFLLGDNNLAKQQFDDVIQQTNANPKNIHRAHALNNLGLLFDNQGAFQKSINHYEKAGAIYKELDNIYLVDLTKMNVGIVLKKTGKYKRGLVLLIESVKGFEQRGDSLQLGEAYSSIGNIQEVLWDLKKAQQFYHKSIQIRRALKDDYGLSSVYNNMGILYMKNKKYDSANTYFLNAASLIENRTNRNLGSIYHNIGLVNQSLGNIDKASSYFQRGLEEKTKIKDTAEMVITLNKLAVLNLEGGGTQKALKYLTLGRSLLQLNPNKRSLKAHYDIWKGYFKERGMIDSALFYLEQSNGLMKRINKEDYLKEVAFLQESFEAEGRNQKIQDLHSSNKSKTEDLMEADETINSRNWIIAGSLCLILILIIVLYFRRNKVLKAKLEGMEIEKNRLSSELHDIAGSNLRSLKSELKILANEEEQEDTRNKFEKIHNRIGAITDTVIDISHELKLPDFKQDKFSMLLSDILFDWFDGKKYKHSIHIENKLLLDGLTEKEKMHVYRFIQESLTNVERHAKASYIEISIRKKAKQLVFTIEDNGVGRIQGKRIGIGHRNLEERAEEIGGSFKFISTEDGSQSTIELPIKFK